MNAIDRRYSPEFQRLLEYAAYDCALRGATEVAPDHVLLGLYREDYPLIDEVLASFRVDSIVVLDRLLKRHPDAPRPTAASRVRMSPEALRVIAYAEDEALRLGQPQVTPPHALLAVLRHNRDNLAPYFIREKIYKDREEKVIAQVRELVSWLRFENEGKNSLLREVEPLDAETLVGLEAVKLEAPDPQELKRFAVRLKMLKRFRGK